MNEKKKDKEKEGEREEAKQTLEEKVEDRTTIESVGSLSSGLGNIRISDNIIAKIAGLAAVEVEGVAGMSSGITEAFSRKNVSRGVKVEAGDQEAIINLYMIMDYGVFIAEVAKKVQQKVKEAVENLTGLKVTAVNIFVQGVQLPVSESEEKKK